ncbi:SDR family NAD(P)-dependent oxidoreductase [Paraburkholderia unamae]|uniref:2-deoxy-D-gluconate 3-dehydrogenase n=1 Tax=Paraburkholderia unamae TaxID=219649 RepID=A0ABX5KSD2_9BURK|nr:SDR family oxidoreductase [Paraburkholderia unamae]PVX85548.1 2-deoxy-D-gluconate 3-dehydrogenase [Paraburkholderia unamae]RAR55243.1 2-deoxy-D-gluconate 3-dehydrogenase [Paraburkholderia unamae]CAG9268079.1 Gluconate 5-dehydrogenase [Paraburkholderia unamae]
MSHASLFDLTGRHALVTGGADGLGAGIARALARAGARVGVIDIAPVPDAVLAKWSAEGQPVFARQADLADRDALHSATHDVLQRFDGRIDILVNNAGHQFRAPGHTHSIEDWDATLALNVTAAFLMSQIIGRTMIERRAGKIINLASIRSFAGSTGALAYGVSKGGVAQLTRSLACDWAPFGVQVNAIAPGFMRTALTDALAGDAAAVERTLERIPARRWGTPDDLAGLAVFLASAASDYVNGAIIPCDGGFLAN